tara:strand:+ start:9053 stop:9694 length:642 start_codon:yes stop_codon:yes gene_type:complete
MAQTSNHKLEKYVPPHMRKNSKQRQNKRNRKMHKKTYKETQDKNEINIDCKESFPQLIDSSFIKKENNDWIEKSKNNIINSDQTHYQEYFNFGNINFKMDKDIKKGWIVLSKDSNMNRGNCDCCECCKSNEDLETMEREIEIENYWDLKMNLSRNNEGIPLIPIKQTPFYYDTEDEQEFDETEENVNELFYDDNDFCVNNSMDYESQSDLDDY